MNSRCSGRAVDRLVSTPEILLLILDHIHDIQTFLAFRHTSHGMLWLSHTYEKSISQRLAFHNFPRCHRLLTLPQPELYTVPWLINLMPRHLAAILIDRHREVGDIHMYGIPAEEPTGDALRARVTNGLRILRKLSLISQRIHNIKPRAPASRLRSQSEQSLEKRDTLTRLRQIVARTPPDVTMTKKIETLILERRMEYVRTMSVEEKEDYQIMCIFLVGCFEHLWGGPFALGVDAPDGPLDFGRPPRKWIGRKDSWANWYILHEGPNLFWEQWWGRNKFLKGHKSAFVLMEEEWLSRNEKIVKVEREAAEKIERELLKGLDHKKYDPPPELNYYKLDVVEEDKMAATDPLGCVPFQVDATLDRHHCTEFCRSWRNRA